MVQQPSDDLSETIRAGHPPQKEKGGSWAMAAAKISALVTAVTGVLGGVFYGGMEVQKKFGEPRIVHVKEAEKPKGEVEKLFGDWCVSWLVNDR